MTRRTLAARPPGVWRFREFLPTGLDDPVTLKEGATGLHPCPRLAAWVGVETLYVKAEGENPTGSFKDRGMTVGVTLARELGFGTVACASTGNTSASMAAYAARAGLKAVVLLPQGKVALGKVAQAIAHGATILEVDGDFDRAMELVRGLAAEGVVYLLNSLNPWRLEGQKTLALEVLQDLGWEAPDAIAFPVGNAGNISAAWKGIREARAAGLVSAAPRLLGIQASGANPLVRAFRAGLKPGVPVASVKAPETVATAIRIGAPVNAPKAVRAVLESNGLLADVSDAQILDAQDAMARLEGIFAEPAGAAGVAGLRALARSSAVGADGTFVCVATGNGLKDPEAVVARMKGGIRRVRATEGAVREALGG